MKTTWLLLALLGGAAVLVAQTDPPKRAKAERGSTSIDSTSMEFQYASREVIYRGNVRVKDPQMDLTCAVLSARFMTNDARLELESIVAETNVVINAIDWEGRTNYATADKLVYFFSIRDGVTNQTIELTGNPRLTNSALGGGLSGTIIFVDLVAGKVFAYDQTTSFQTDAVKALQDDSGKKKQDKPE
jgi:lipopolysaccharide export system protein LptA